MSGSSFRSGRGNPAAAVAAAAERGALLGAEHVLQVAKSRAPIEEATLERSGKATVETDGAGQVRSAVSFDTPYAARQHEELDWRHDDGRQAKYLESALTGEADVVARLLQRALREELGG